jgi:hypothetical protein
MLLHLGALDLPLRFSSLFSRTLNLSWPENQMEANRCGREGVVSFPFQLQGSTNEEKLTLYGSAQQVNEPTQIWCLSLFVCVCHSVLQETSGEAIYIRWRNGEILGGRTVAVSVSITSARAPTHSYWTGVVEFGERPAHTILSCSLLSEQTLSWNASRDTTTLENKFCRLISRS